ncbi:MAG: diiron oxygenase [Burkholderiales bacterium]|nr:diiron oxygenase [Burkholderiales bacterium]
MSPVFESQDVIGLSKKISEKSLAGYYNPYTKFNWTDSVDTGKLWVDADLLSVYGTPYIDELSKEQLINLSKWESINFYSLNVHGIKELINEMVNRIHHPRYKSISQFLHHFIGEENEHMWFFAEFCNRYGRIYPSKAIPGLGKEDQDIEDFIVFSRVVIFEEIVDYYNSKVGGNTEVHPLIKDINYYHHIDESRHVAFGRGIIKALFSALKEKLDEQELEGIRTYLAAYMKSSLEQLYSPSAYRDAGIPTPHDFRRKVMNHPGRTESHKKMIKRTFNFFESIGAIRKEDEKHVCEFINH